MTRCFPSSATTGSAPSCRGPSFAASASWASSARRSRSYGCPGLSPIACGLMHMELNRGDGSLGTLLGVQSGLAMKSIAMLGSEEQKQRWLPEMARFDKLGAFALTEPDHGSDSVALETTARGMATPTSSTAPSAGSATAPSPTSSSSGPGRGRSGPRVLGGEGHPRLRRPGDRGQGLPAGGVAGAHHPHRRSRAAGQPPPGARTFKDTAVFWREPGARARGQRWAMPSPRMRPRSPTPSGASSSASRWPASRSCRTALCACSPR